jgi:hypothetical protein
VYTAHICVVLEPRIDVDVECDMFDISEDGSIQLYGRGEMVGHFPSVEFIHLTGGPSVYADDEEEDDEDEEAEDLSDIAAHVTSPDGDTSALNGTSPDDVIVGVVED